MSQEELTPRFDLSQGAGAPLGTLPCFTTVSNRGAAGKALEAALEPLHRLVYGRPGKVGERRGALETFKGFPAAMQAEVQGKMDKLTKDRLRDIIKALGISVHISLTHAEVAAGVASFLMKPCDEGRVKVSGTSKSKGTRTSSARSSPATESPKDEPLYKKAKMDIPPPPSTAPLPPALEPRKGTTPTSSASGAASVSDDTVRVEVYRRVLALTPEEREVLGVKALRTSLEDHFRIPAGGLRERKNVIAETASECVRALKEVEDRATARCQRAVRDDESWASPAGSAPPIRAAVEASAGKLNNTAVMREVAATRPAEAL